MSQYSMDDIARFAEGNMTEEERVQFSAALSSDSELKEQFDFYQNVQSSLRMKLLEDDEDRAFKESLSQTSRQYFRKEAKVVSFKKYLAYAAAIAAIIVVVLWAPWSKNLYDRYSSTEMIATVERGDQGKEAKLQKAADAFNRKDFEQSSAILSQVLKSDPDNSMAKYYYAISLLQINKIGVARTAFFDLYRGESVFKFDAAFYIALSYLKEKDGRECVTWLRKIPQDASIHDKSEELLKELE